MRGEIAYHIIRRSHSKFIRRSLLKTVGAQVAPALDSRIEWRTNPVEIRGLARVNSGMRGDRNCANGGKAWAIGGIGYTEWNGVSPWISGGDGVSVSARAQGIAAATSRGRNNTVPLPGHGLPELGVGAGAPLCARVP
jgi:hypothetical protein